MKSRRPFSGLIVSASAAVALCAPLSPMRRLHRPKAPGWTPASADPAFRRQRQSAIEVHDRTAQGRHARRCHSTTSATSRRPSAASSPRRLTGRSWPRPAKSPGTWGATSSCLQGKDFDSIHPSLQRQAVLNMAYGLYEVVPGRIYQVRGFDLANISFIKGDTGWIVFDPLTAKETAHAALDFVNEKLGKRPVVARRLLAFAWRSLRRRARRRRRGRRASAARCR